MRGAARRRGQPRKFTIPLRSKGGWALGGRPREDPRPESGLTRVLEEIRGAGRVGNHFEGGEGY